uniref:Uncharacterized protein n=1 Tax=Aegilops tauschii subsp. strangulata TaxID=200361 RepID=A0A453NU33_AEGTS
MQEQGDKIQVTFLQTFFGTGGNSATRRSRGGGGGGKREGNPVVLELKEVNGQNFLEQHFYLRVSTGRNLPRSANIFAHNSPDLLPVQHEELQTQLCF